jgi:protein-disulfide isomerase
LGDAEAPITIFEASDFQCPYCRDFWSETLPIIERDYIRTGKVRLIFLNFPITQIHPNAAAAHELAMCAAVQDRFWPVHDLLYRYQAQWEGLGQPTSYFMALADSAGLHREELDTCLETGSVRRLILEEAQAAWQAGIRSTPSFVIEGGLLTGAQPIAVWRPILDSLVAAKTKR